MEQPRKQKDTSILYSIIIVCIFLLIVGVSILFSRDIDKQDDVKKIPGSIDEVKWITYESKDFGFSIQYPEHWEVHEGFREVPPSVSFYKDELGVDVPFTPHDNATHISVYPQGLSSELPSGSFKIGTVDTSEDENSVRDFVLTDSSSWATIIDFNQTPESWRPWGFIWSSLSISDLSYSCDRGIEITSVEFCDPTIGDVIQRSGNVDSKDRGIQEKMLETFEFTS